MKPIPVFLLCLLLFLSGPEPVRAGWKAAVRKVDITPDQVMWMAGYASRKGPAEGTRSPLYAKLLLLEDGKGSRFVLVTLDLIGVPADLRREWEGAFARLGIPASHLLINASHTHSGPMIRLIPPFRSGQQARAAYASVPEEEQGTYIQATQQYRQKLSLKVLEAARSAGEGLQEVKLYHGKSRCGFAMNRRLPTDRGFINSPNPEGPVDHEVPILEVRGGNGKPLAIAFGYACHNTVLGFMNWSGDYAGWAQQYIEEEHPGSVALFVTGCGGDQNPYPRRQEVWAERHGRSLATAVEAALQGPVHSLKDSLSAAFTRVDLDYAPAPDRATLESRLASKDRYEKRHAAFLLEYLEATGSLPDSYPYPVQVVRLGQELTLFALGGEVVVDYSLRLKEEFGKGHVWVAGYSNDVMGYIPSLRVLQEGGYEGGGAMRYVRSIPHPGSWAESVEDRILETVRRLHRELE